MTGQMSLFDLVSDDQKTEFEIPASGCGRVRQRDKACI